MRIVHCASLAGPPVSERGRRRPVSARAAAERLGRYGADAGWSGRVRGGGGASPARRHAVGPTPVDLAQPARGCRPARRSSAGSASHRRAPATARAWLRRRRATSGRNTTRNAPIAGPTIVAAPPTTTATSRVIDRLMLNCSALHERCLERRTARPPTPASMALTPKVEHLVARPGSRRATSAAVSLSRMAMSARPDPALARGCARGRRPRRRTPGTRSTSTGRRPGRSTPAR